MVTIFPITVKYKAQKSVCLQQQDTLLLNRGKFRAYFILELVRVTIWSWTLETKNKEKQKTS